eukprot:5291127-Karenia_brevis.AAC.1
MVEDQKLFAANAALCSQLRDLRQSHDALSMENDEIGWHLWHLQACASAPWRADFCDGKGVNLVPAESSGSTN